jgi:regulatory protein YycI of two-component signal transduction system YycFG
MGLLFISVRFSFLFIVLFFSVSAYITSWFFNKKVAKILKILDEQAVDENGKENRMIVLDKTEILG